MSVDWKVLFHAACAVHHPREVSPFVEAGGVAAALLTESGHIYTGVCIDTACSLGMCAERNAIAHMLTCGENQIAALLCVMRDGRLGLPCGACRELLLQLNRDHDDLVILTDLERGEAVRLGDLMPFWWGQHRLEEE